jgi:hypothetical protein
MFCHQEVFVDVYKWFVPVCLHRKVGHYYAHPGNWFWKVLKESGICPPSVRGAEDDHLMAGCLNRPCIISVRVHGLIVICDTNVAVLIVSIVIVVDVLLVIIAGVVLLIIVVQSGLHVFQVMYVQIS